MSRKRRKDSEFTSGRRHGWWTAVAVLLVLLGATGSFFGARAVARNDAQKAREASLATSTAIASRLGLTIQREQDLVVTAAAFIAGNPTASQAQFEQAMNAIHAFERYPELQGIAELVLVPASQLSAFAAQEMAASGSFQVSPPGVRPYYCFTTLLESRKGQSFAGGGIDVCDTVLGPLIMKARDTGQGAYLPYGTGKGAGLVLGTPVYRGSSLPTTVQARHNAFIGWVGTEIAPNVVLESALDGYPGHKVVFHYEGGSSNVRFEAGTVAAGGQSTTINLHNGWNVQSLGWQPQVGCSPTRAHWSSCWLVSCSA